MPCCHDNHNTVIELAMQRRAAFGWAGQKAMRSLRSSSLRSPDALHLSSNCERSELPSLFIASEASFLVCSMRGFSIYIYIYMYIYIYIYRISSINRPGVYFFRRPIYPAFIGDRRLFEAGVYFHMYNFRTRSCSI